jgi:ABC-2 type transport system permease protein/oleandomycin transport system permease protein
MTTITAPAAPALADSGHRLRWVFNDILTVTWRNLVALTRTPEAMFFSTLQPIMFVLLFAYVFGGAISIPHLKYIDFLIPGIFVQTVSFGSVSTAVGLSEDLQKGLIERFRALPMARSAVLAGRTASPRSVSRPRMPRRPRSWSSPSSSRSRSPRRPSCRWPPCRAGCRRSQRTNR